MKVAIIGTVGVPACYGGFETLVENLLDHKHNTEIEYQIYCSSKRYEKRLKTYKGAKLVYLPFDANGWQSAIYDALSFFHAYATCEVLVSMGCSGVFVLPLLRLFYRKRLIIHLDGLDYNRDKFSPFCKKVIKRLLNIAVKNSDIRISDNQAIKQFFIDNYHRDSELIEYGGDNAFIINDEEKLFTKYGLKKGSYCFKVARIEPENNIEMILRAFYQMPNEQLVLVGNWERSDFGRQMKKEFKEYPNIKLLDPVFEPEDINLLRSNCRVYIHGHSVGGTNPSLVEAMSSHLPIFAYNVVFNKETTEYKASYFDSSESLVSLILSVSEEELINNADDMLEIANRRYKWDIIANKYEKLFLTQ